MADMDTTSKVVGIGSVSSMRTGIVSPRCFNHTMLLTTSADAKFRG